MEAETSWEAVGKVWVRDDGSWSRRKLVEVVLSVQIQVESTRLADELHEGNERKRGLRLL